MTAILWLRRDLRIHDHPALEAARNGADHLVPVFCFDNRLLHGRHSSGPRTQFLLECLADLDRSLARGAAAWSSVTADRRLRCPHSPLRRSRRRPLQRRRGRVCPRTATAA